MALKRYSCRTHGGIFSKESTRGRPPVRCAEEYPCDKANQPIKVNAGAVSRENTYSAADKRQAISSTVREVPGVGKVAVITGPRGAHKAAESDAKPTSGANDSLPLAKRAKAQLEAVGWVCKGRAWVTAPDEHPYGDCGLSPKECSTRHPNTVQHFAELICSRGAETLVIVWQNGVLHSQDYQMEHLREQDNGLPGRKLDFDPDELTDREIVQRISGMKVTWWSVLASSTETAVVPGDKVKIEHIFVGNGDEDNSKRIVTFVDRNNGGFRSFHVSALMKVG